MLKQVKLLQINVFVKKTTIKLVLTLLNVKQLSLKTLKPTQSA